MIMQTSKRNPRAEYRQKQRERVEASQAMAEKFPSLKSLAARLAYHDADGHGKPREMKCTVNVDHAKSVFCFACPSGECIAGDFDLTQALAKAIAGRKKMIEGDLRCHGYRVRGAQGKVQCQVVLHYKLTLDYNPARSKPAKPAAKTPKPARAAGKRAARA